MLQNTSHDAILQLLVSDSEQATRLRSSSPFADILNMAQLGIHPLSPKLAYIE